MDMDETRNSFNFCCRQYTKYTGYPESCSSLHFSEYVERVVQWGFVVILQLKAIKSYR